MISRLSAAGVLGALLSISAPIGSVQAGNAQLRDTGKVRVAERGQRPARPSRHQQPRGDWSRHTEGQRTDNGHTSHSTWTGENGKTATRDAAVVNDREAGTRTRDVTYTGPEGKTRTVNDVTQRTENGHTRDTTVTDAEGRTATRAAVVTRDDADRTSTRVVTYTGRDGQETVVNDVNQRTDAGYTRETTVTRPNGATGTRSVVVNCDKAAGNCSKDVQVDRPD
jgi:hypothetical protein